MTGHEAKELAEVAKRAAREAGVTAREAFCRGVADPRHKGAVDLVTDADLQVEGLLRERLIGDAGFAFLGEEGGRSGPEKGPLWIVDPIDGTTNFAHGVPHFCVSIALWDGEGGIVAAIYDPMADELFWCDDERAYLGDAALLPLADTGLADALLASGFPYDRRTNPDDNSDLWRAFMKRCRGVRRFGAAALDLAWLAAGRVDGFWEARLKPWDVAGGLTLLRRLGACATDYRGTPHTLDHAHLVVAPPRLHVEMLGVIRSRWRAPLP